MNAAKDFYAAQAAYGNLLATHDIEQAAQDSFKAASARVDKGVAPISDQLQAQTLIGEIHLCELARDVAAAFEQRHTLSNIDVYGVVNQVIRPFNFTCYRVEPR